MAEEYRKSGGFTGKLEVSWGIPLRGKMDRGVAGWPGHLTGDHKGFHTSCGQLFWLISEVNWGC